MEALLDASPRRHHEEVNTEQIEAEMREALQVRESSNTKALAKTDTTETTTSPPKKKPKTLKKTAAHAPTADVATKTTGKTERQWPAKIERNR